MWHPARSALISSKRGCQQRSYNVVAETWHQPWVIAQTVLWDVRFCFELLLNLAGVNHLVYRNIILLSSFRNIQLQYRIKGMGMLLINLCHTINLTFIKNTFPFKIVFNFPQSNAILGYIRRHTNTVLDILYVKTCFPPNWKMWWYNVQAQNKRFFCHPYACCQQWPITELNLAIWTKGTPLII